MSGKCNRPSGIGLERSCSGSTSNWIRSSDVAHGVELLEVWFQGYAYQKHRHDTYAICLTKTGVQAFDYRGASEVSTPGRVVVLHPDEIHNGHAATEEGLGYQMLYIDPSLIFEAARVICGHDVSLPFVHPPVVTNRKLSTAIIRAFRDTCEPLAMDSLIVKLAEGLIDATPCCGSVPIPRNLDIAALERAQQFLDAEKNRVVGSSELEEVTGLTRYELARQFRFRYGTSPYHYLLMRRVDFARMLISQKQHPLAEIALETGFADQAHFTRMFKAGFGITPARYRALTARGVQGLSRTKA